MQCLNTDIFPPPSLLLFHTAHYWIHRRICIKYPWLCPFNIAKSKHHETLSFWKPWTQTVECNLSVSLLLKWVKYRPYSVSLRRNTYRYFTKNPKILQLCWPNLSAPMQLKHTKIMNHSITQLYNRCRILLSADDSNYISISTYCSVGNVMAKYMNDARLTSCYHFVICHEA